LARRLKYSRGTSPQEFQDLLPGRRDADNDVAEIVVPAVDEETLGIEATDEDTEAVRSATGRPNVDAFEESDTTDLEVGRDEPTHFGGVRKMFERGEKLALLLPVFAGRVRNWRLPGGEPSERRLVLTSELLIRVQSTHLRVEVGGLDLTHVECGHRRGRCGHDGATVLLAPLEHIKRRQTFGEGRDLFVSVDDARANLGDLLRRDEIRAEDGLRHRVVRCRHQSRRVQCCFHRHHLLLFDLPKSLGDDLSLIETSFISPNILRLKKLVSVSDSLLKSYIL